MTKQADVSFTTQKFDKPAGVTPGGFAATLLLAGSVVTTVALSEGQRSAQFLITEAGSYTVQVSRVSSTGEHFGPSASSAPFDIAADQLDVPLAVTVVLSDPPAAPNAIA